MASEHRFVLADFNWLDPDGHLRAYEGVPPQDGG